MCELASLASVLGLIRGLVVAIDGCGYAGVLEGTVSVSAEEREGEGVWSKLRKRVRRVWPLCASD